MGINNLLKFMKPYVEPIHIKKYAGKRVGIDAYSWLHKGAYSCSMELCLNTEGEKKFQFLNYFMHRLNLLRHYQITPVVVFDGGHLPCKAATEDERNRRRKTNRDLAMEKLKEGDASSAVELFQRAVTITPQMAHQLIQILKSEDIEFVVAPYEADAQLAYLSSIKADEGGIVAVISEDSDLLAYGCPAIVFKMDRYGNGEEIALDTALTSVGRGPSFQKFNKELFTGMCVLAGCDFLPSIPGIGIVKAYNVVSKYQNLDRVLSVLKFERGKQMPEDYPKAFKEAIAVFRHARIYDAELERLKPMKPLPETFLQFEDEKLDFLGPDLSPSIAAAIAKGNLDPCTMEAFDHFPQVGNLHRPRLVKPSHHMLRQEAANLRTMKSCFTAISCHPSKKEGNKGDTLSKEYSALEGVKLKPISEELHIFDEPLALENLASDISNKCSKENKKVCSGIVLNLPDNNPFKRRKLESEEVQLDNAEAVDVRASEVSHIETSEILYRPQESQGSVDSIPVKRTYKKNRLKGENHLKSCLNAEPKKNSILNFFPRL